MSHHDKGKLSCTARGREWDCPRRGAWRQMPMAFYDVMLLTSGRLSVRVKVSARVTKNRKRVNRRPSPELPGSRTACGKMGVCLYCFHEIIIPTSHKEFYLGRPDADAGSLELDTRSWTILKPWRKNECGTVEVMRSRAEAFLKRGGFPCFMQGKDSQYPEICFTSQWRRVSDFGLLRQWRCLHDTQRYSLGSSKLQHCEAVHLLVKEVWVFFSMLMLIYGNKSILFLILSL